MSKLFYKIESAFGVRDYFEVILPTSKVEAFLKENHAVEVRRYDN